MTDVTLYERYKKLYDLGKFTHQSVYKTLKVEGKLFYTWRLHEFKPKHNSIVLNKKINKLEKIIKEYEDGK